MVAWIVYRAGNNGCLQYNQVETDEGSLAEVVRKTKKRRQQYQTPTMLDVSLYMFPTTSPAEGYFMIVVHAIAAPLLSLESASLSADG